jgi:hypothetical protein
VSRHRGRNDAFINYGSAAAAVPVVEGQLFDLPVAFCPQTVRNCEKPSHGIYVETSAQICISTRVFLPMTGENMIKDQLRVMM